MYARLTLLLLAVLLVIPAVGSATVVEILPSQDTYVVANAPNLAVPDREYVIVKYTTTPVVDEARAYMQFDLSSIPSDATINAAYLYLYQSDVDCGGTELTIHKVTSAWIDDLTTWNNQPSSQSAVYTRIERPTPCGWFIIPLTSLVDQWHQGTLSNNGIMMKQMDRPFLEDADPRIFTSSEAASDQPKLVVVYNSTSAAMDPVQDAYVSQAAPGTIFGSSTDLLLSGSATAALRSYLQFDLSEIPAGSVIEFARLRVFHYYTSPLPSEGDRAGAYEVMLPWDESTIKWSAQPSRSSLEESFKGAYGDSDWGGRMDWIVTDLVADWVNGSKNNYGIVLKHLTEDLTTAVTGTFYSSDFGNSNYWPILEVFYAAPPPNVFANGQQLPGVFFSDAQWGDLDGDGHNDLVMCGQTATDTVTVTYKNQSGNLISLTNSLPGIMSEGSGCLALGDYDNDGDLDLAMAGLGKSTTGRIARIYKNDGNGHFTWDTAQVLTAVSNASVAWGDTDADGDLDLVVQGLDGSSNTIATLYLNDPLGTLTPDPTTVLTGLRNGSVDWGDIDEDGDLDLMRTGYDASNATRTIISVEDSTGTLGEDGAHGLPGAGLSDAAFGDFNRDGRLDVAITGHSDDSPSDIARIYRNIGAGQFTAHTTNFAVIYRSSCAWGDFDNDGRLDVAFCGWTGGSQITNIYRCNASYGYTFYGSVTGTREGSLTWVDVDEDADLDLFATGSNFTTKLAKVCRNDGAIPNTSPTPPTSLAAFQDFFVPLADGKLYITWSGATDSETTLPGLYYCVRVGTERTFFEASDDVFSGTYGTPLMGNVGQATTMEISIPYPDRPYYVQVKTIDAGLMASEWSHVFCTWDEGTVHWVEIPVDADAFVDRSTPDTAHGVATDILLTVGDFMATTPPDVARTYLRFYLPPPIPEFTTRILRAELWMNCTGALPATPYWVGVREEYFDGWNENSITWENAQTTFKPGWTAMTRVSGPGWNYWDVTRDVKGTVDPDLTLVLMGYSPSESTPGFVAEFWSKEAGPPTQPYLKVWYSTITGIGDGSPRPNRFELSQNVPNPFNPDTRISFTIPEGSSANHVTLRIYDVAGRLVRTLLDQPKTPGIHTVTWNGKDQRGSSVATGVYFYRLQWNGKTQSKKMVLLR